MSKTIYPRGIRKKRINGIFYAFKKKNGQWRCICAGSTEEELRSWVSFVYPHPNIDIAASD